MSIFSSDAHEESVFQELLKICDGLQEKLLASSEEEVELVADLVVSDMLYCDFQLICTDSKGVEWVLC